MHQLREKILDCPPGILAKVEVVRRKVNEPCGDGWKLLYGMLYERCITLMPSLNRFRADPKKLPFLRVSSWCQVYFL
jgi:hypothetical protein